MKVGGAVGRRGVAATPGEYPNWDVTRHDSHSTDTHLGGTWIGITSLIWTPTGQKKVSIVSEVSSFQRLKCMQEWYLGWEKVSSIQECPYREWFYILCTVYSIQDSCTIVRQTFAGQRSWFRVIRTDRLKLRGRGRRGRGGHAHSGPGGWWKE